MARAVAAGRRDAAAARARARGRLPRAPSARPLALHEHHRGARRVRDESGARAPADRSRARRRQDRPPTRPSAAGAGRARAGHHTAAG